MAVQSINTVVTVRGEAFRITNTRLVTEGRFYGRIVFDLLRVSDGAEFGYLGKRVQSNSKLTPRNSATVDSVDTQDTDTGSTERRDTWRLQATCGNCGNGMDKDAHQCTNCDRLDAENRAYAEFVENAPVDSTESMDSTDSVMVDVMPNNHGYPYRAVCFLCGYRSAGYVAEHAAQSMADAHKGECKGAPVESKPYAVRITQGVAAGWREVTLSDGSDHHVTERAAYALWPEVAQLPTLPHSWTDGETVDADVPTLLPVDMVHGHRTEWIKSGGEEFPEIVRRAFTEVRNSYAGELFGLDRDGRATEVRKFLNTRFDTGWTLSRPWFSVRGGVGLQEIADAVLDAMRADRDNGGETVDTAPVVPVAPVQTGNGWNVQPEQQHKGYMVDRAAAELDASLDTGAELDAERDTEDTEPEYFPTYTIAAWKLPEFVSRVEKANRKLDRAGAPEDARFTFTTEDTERARYVGGMELPDGTKFGGTWVTEPFVIVTLSAFRLAIGPFVFVASLVREETGYVTHNAPGQSLAGWTRPDADDMSCDHCATRRIRNRLYVIRNSETGELAQIGASCVQLYTGVKPAGLFGLEFGDELSELTGDDDEFNPFARGRDYRAPVDDVLLYAWTHSDHGRSYVSRAAAFDGRRSTGDLVSTSLFSTGANMTPEDRAFFADHALQVDVIRADADGCADLLRRIKGAVDGIDADSDYGMNMRVCVSGETVGDRNIGILASLVAAYARQEQLRVEREQAPAKVTGYYAPVGAKLRDFSLTVGLVRYWDGYRDGDVTTFISGTTETGHTVTWKASREIDIETGDTLTLEYAAVKAHETYRETDQTVLTRARIGSIRRAGAE